MHPIVDDAMTDTLLFDAELIHRYDRQGPRYTSYPTAPQFHANFDVGAYRNAALLSNDALAPLSIYVHVPFCANPCFYCGCNKVITRSTTAGDRYVAALKREIELQGALFHQQRKVEQLHFGGGTPTFLSVQQLAAILRTIEQEFSLAPPSARETSIEIDPRTVRDSTLVGLANLGFNRLSIGVQDFDTNVQLAVNRVQSVEDTRSIVASARSHGIEAINFDLIYGLPRQTLASFGRTLRTVIEMRPTRIAAYGYAHMPATFKPQRRIDHSELPSPAERLALLRLMIESLTEAGYVYIGMDHFALPDDPLATALANGSLQRNFQGYSSRPDCDLVGLGVSSIGKVGDAYAQNAKTLSDYYERVENHQLAIRRGLKLNSDDRVRRDVIQQIMCRGVLDCSQLERDHCIEFRDYFASELTQLEALRADGLLSEVGERIVVSDKGRLLVRHVAMVFDAYLPRRTEEAYSQAI